MVGYISAIGNPHYFCGTCEGLFECQHGTNAETSNICVCISIRCRGGQHRVITDSDARGVPTVQFNTASILGSR